MKALLSGDTPLSTDSAKDKENETKVIITYETLSLWLLLMTNNLPHDVFCVIRT